MPWLLRVDVNFSNVLQIMLRHKAMHPKWSYFVWKILLEELKG